MEKWSNDVENYQRKNTKKVKGVSKNVKNYQKKNTADVSKYQRKNTKKVKGVSKNVKKYQRKNTKKVDNINNDITSMQIRQQRLEKLKGNVHNFQNATSQTLDTRGKILSTLTNEFDSLTEDLIKYQKNMNEVIKRVENKIGLRRVDKVTVYK